MSARRWSRVSRFERPAALAGLFHRDAGFHRDSGRFQRNLGQLDTAGA